MSDDLPETSNLSSSDVQAPVSGTCEEEDQDEDEMLRLAIDLSLRNDDAPVCEPQPESKLENYQYSPLPTTDKTIRLLCIPPADDLSVPLVCDMHQVRLIDKPKYAALSYTWGAPIFDHHIICSGRRLAITAHLDAALRRFRKSTWWMLWVDAVCIDQTNIPERNYQVSIMQHIYFRATVTFVYLGEGCLQDAVALRLMCALRDLAQLSKRYSLAELKSMEPLDNALTPRVLDALIRFMELKEGSPNASTGTRADLSSVGIPHPGDPAWEAMKSLLSYPWFSRMWIIQEVVMSSNVCMMLGKFSFHWKLVTDSLSAYIELGLLYATEIANQRVAMNFRDSGKVVLSLLKVKNDPQCRSLIKLMNLFRKCLCSDPRDKLYALLGLANDQGAHNMVSVDYSKSVEAVYLECAKSLVRNRDGMEMLIDAGLTQDHGDNDFKMSLPSWVPNWSREKLDFFGQRQELFRDLYRAAGETQSEIEVEDRGNGLNVRGIRIDVVDALATVLATDEDKGGLLKSELFAWEQEARKVAQQSCFFSEERVDDYANTVGACLSPRPGVINGFNSVHFLLESFWNRRSAQASVDQAKYLAYVGTMAHTQKFCVTRQGYMGWVPVSSQPGDFIIVLYGGHMPFTVRKTDGKYLLLGASYLRGFMYGEALKLEDAEPEVFVLE